MNLMGGRGDIKSDNVIFYKCGELFSKGIFPRKKCL